MWLRWIIYAVSILISFLLQTSVFEFLKLADTVPNVMLTLVVCIALMRGRKEGLLTGFFCGLLIDLFYGDVLGWYALLYTGIGYINGYFNHRYFQDDVILPLAVLGGNALVYDILVYIFFFLLRGRLGFFYFLIHIILPDAIYTAIFAIVMYYIMMHLLGWLADFEEKGVL